MTRPAGGAGTNQYARRGKARTVSQQPATGTPSLVQQINMTNPPPADYERIRGLLPRVTLGAQGAYRDIASQLSQWAPTVHQLVQERIAALVDAYGPYDHPLETAQQYAERVLAHGQYPFPPGTSLYDDLNINTGYNHINVGYGLPGEDGSRITYTGQYPEWADDGGSCKMRTVRIHCPGWLVSEPDGVERYRQQTVGMAEAIRAERAQLAAQIEAQIDEVMAARNRKPSQGI